MIKLWRLRWTDSPKLSKGAFVVTVVLGLTSLALIWVWVQKDYTGPWEHASNYFTVGTFVALTVQLSSEVRERRRRERQER